MAVVSVACQTAAISVHGLRWPARRSSQNVTAGSGDATCCSCRPQLTCKGQRLTIGPAKLWQGTCLKLCGWPSQRMASSPQDTTQERCSCLRTEVSNGVPVPGRPHER